MEKTQSMDDDSKKPCLKCTVKHLLGAKTFMMEAVQFGASFNVDVEDLNKVILKLANHILSTKGDANGR